MSVKSLIASSRVQNDFVISSVPSFYAAAVTPIFNITGGPVWIKAMVEYLDTAMTNATTTTITVCGIACDAGPVLIDAGAIGSVVLSPLNASAKNASALAEQWPNAAGVATQGGFGMIAGLGAITVTFATVMDLADRYSLHIVYQKLSNNSLIS